MLVGVSVFFIENGNLHLNYTAVSKNHRNIGINKLMKKELISYAKGKNISKITANVRESNIFSVKSLISSGFKLDNENTTKYESSGNTDSPSERNGTSHRKNSGICSEEQVQKYGCFC
jgi:predicted acetyltransferase